MQKPDEMRGAVKAQITQAVIRIKNYASTIGDMESLFAIDRDDSGQAFIAELCAAIEAKLVKRTLTLPKNKVA